MQSFREKLKSGLWRCGNFACLGMDSDIGNPKFPKHLEADKNPEKAVRTFNSAIIAKSAAAGVMAYKPNAKFYRKIGRAASAVLVDTFAMIHDVNPNAFTILDDKDNDIGNTCDGAIQFAREHCKASAMTVNPYMGAWENPEKGKPGDGIQNIFDCADMGVIVLARTSNKGAGQIQDKPVCVFKNELYDMGVDDELMSRGPAELGWMPIGGYMAMPLYQYISLLADRVWNKNGNCALVFGANNAKPIKNLRILCPTIPLLLPAFGTQMDDGKTDVEGATREAVQAASDGDAGGFLGNNSRGALFASSGEDFAEAAASTMQAFDAKLRNLVRGS